jgi:hypothetical protein
MHSYRKILFPALREQRFVRSHRGRGHRVLHYSQPSGLVRCYWRCDCQARHWC